MIAVSGLASASAAEKPAANAAHVFLLRGFLNVFSLGLDEFAETLERNGIRADVYNHILAPVVAAEAASEYKSGRTRKIILIGHSMGAAAVIQVLGELGQRKIPVALAVTMAAGSLTIPSGTATNFVHMYTSTGGPMVAGPNFHGHLANLDLSNTPGIDHLSIDKDQIVQSMLLGYISRAIQSTHVVAAPDAAPGR